MTKQRRAIVIGAGHNGLVCAIMLAKAGCKVAIHEARAQIGGGLANRDLADGFKAPGLAHFHHGLHPRIAKDVGLVADERVAVNTIALRKGGGHRTLKSGAVEGEALSEADAQAYSQFRKDFTEYAKALSPLLLNKPPRLKDMDSGDQWTLAKVGWSLRFGLGAQSMQEFLRVGGANIYDILNEIFDDDLLKAAIALDAVQGQHMGPRTPTSVLTLLQLLFGDTHSARGTPILAPASLTQQLEKAARDNGVEIVTNSSVLNLVISDGRVSGVVLVNGETVDADIVASNADAKSTFLKLVSPGDLDAMFVHRISKTRTNGNVARLTLALSGMPEFTGLSENRLGNRLLVAPDMNYIERAFNAAKYGRFSEQPVLEILIPSIHDRSLAPEGGQVMSINASYAPYKLKGGWDSGRETFADLVINTLDSYAPGIRNLIQHKELLTPVDIERDYGVAGGHWHHGEMTIDQSFMMRPVHGAAQYNAPIDGLFLCGAAAHPGGGITGLPGWNAARRILSVKTEPPS
ncbi:MAG: NAD(P)/FAD-dependent oxidoreductase [Pseudomonadota bacterium]